MSEKSVRVRVKKGQFPKLKSMAEPRTRVPVDVRYTREQTEQISLGKRPRDMDEKWIIYREGDEVFVHRSWTGICMFIARLEEDAEGCTLTEIAISREPDHAPRDPEDASALVRRIIDLVLLAPSDEDAPFGTLTMSDDPAET